MTEKVLNIHPEIESALAANKPVVALESTVIAHGLPRPQNIETAQRLEQIAREEGAIPATIAVIDGQLCVGLNQKQLELIAKADDIKKLSTRDLPIYTARNWNGASTFNS